MATPIRQMLLLSTMAMALLVVVATAFAATPPPPCPPPAALGDGWMAATPESVGFEPLHLCAIAAAVSNGRLRNVHGVVVVRYGRLVFEDYFAGSDERRGAPLGTVTFGPTTLHDVRSVTKSVVSLLYGIAAAQGAVPAIDRPILDGFPEFTDLRGYNQPGNWRTPMAVLNQFVLPALVGDGSR